MGHRLATLCAALELIGCAAAQTSGQASGSGAGSTTSASTTTSGGTSTSGTTGGDIWTTDGGVTVTVSTLAGDGVAGFRDGSGGRTGTARFEGPNGVAVDSQGNVYVADTLGHRIRQIDPSGNVTTLAGNGGSTFKDGTGGPTGTASFGYPSGLALDPQGFLLVSDDGLNRIRKVALSDGTTTTLAGTGVAGFVDGSSAAEFNFNDYKTLGFSGMCGDGQGHFFIADVTNNAIRTLDENGNVGTLAGNGARGFADGSGGRDGTAKLNAPGACAVDAAGNVYVADFGNNRIREIDGNGNVTTLAGNGSASHQDGSGGADGTAEINHPAGLAYDPGSGTLFAPDTFSDCIQHIAIDGTTTTIAGSVTGWRDGAGAQAEFDAPAGMIVDAQGRLIVVDFFGYDVRVLTFQ